MNPTLLPVDDAATIWSVPARDVESALAARALLVVMHGYGSNERDLAALFPSLPSGVVAASLRAPIPVPVAPGRGWAWFPVTDQQNAGSPDPAIADAAARGVLRWLESTQARVRTAGPVGLLGFSQGGVMVTHLLRHSPESFACGVNLSGFSVAGLVAGDEALEQIRPPVFWGRGEADPVITAAAVVRTEAFLPGHTTLTSRLYPGVGHGISGEELADVSAFLTRHLRR